MKINKLIKRKFLDLVFRGNRIAIFGFRFISKVLWHMNFNKTIEARIALKLLKNTKMDRILDIGCGNGVFTDKLKGEVVGVDLSYESLKRAIIISKKDFIVANAEFLPFKNFCFDKVVSLCVFEHLKDDEKVLEEIKRVLKPNGILVLTVDSFSCENDRLIIEKHKKEHGIVRYYTIDVIKSKLEKSGFKLVEYRYFISKKFFIRLGVKYRFGLKYKILFPIAYLLSFLERNRETGYFLAIKALKEL